MDSAPLIVSFEDRLAQASEKTRQNFRIIHGKYTSCTLNHVIFAIAEHGKKNAVYLRYLYTRYPKLAAISRETPNVFDAAISYVLRGNPFSRNPDKPGYELALAIADDLGIDYTTLCLRGNYIADLMRHPAPDGGDAAKPDNGKDTKPDDDTPTVTEPVPAYRLDAGGKKPAPKPKRDYSTLNALASPRNRRPASPAKTYPKCLVTSLVDFMTQDFKRTGVTQTAGEVMSMVSDLDKVLGKGNNRAPVLADLENILAGNTIALHDKRAAFAVIQDLTGLPPLLLEAELEHGLLRANEGGTETSLQPQQPRPVVHRGMKRVLKPRIAQPD